MPRKTMVFGIYSARASAETAAEALVSAGFSSSDICALMPGNIAGTHAETEPERKSFEPVGRRAPSARGVFRLGRTWNVGDSRPGPNGWRKHAEGWIGRP